MVEYLDGETRGVVPRDDVDSADNEVAGGRLEICS